MAGKNERACAWCGADISHRCARAIYCSRKCAVAAGNARRIRLDDPRCQVCRSIFQRRGSSDLYCSVKCRRVVKNENRRKTASVEKECQMCSGIFTTSIPSKVFCSNTCKKRVGYLRNADDQRARCRAYREKNVEFHRERARTWREENNARVSQYNHEYSKRPNAVDSRAKRYEAKANDPVWIAANRTRARLSGHLRQIDKEKGGSTFDMLGYTPQELADHLERQFDTGMGWHNRDKWHIDHIVPISTAKTIEDVIALNQLSNLRPLWAQDNLSKSDRLDYMV